jgi:alkanesulfonate monooxygenase SsuD/methylene tetrahydromethanopterin reductase-like flavin-dependent oxidoreductase (luciferase family)
MIAPALSKDRPFKIGFMLTAMFGGMRDGLVRWPEIRAMAECAESVGFDSFWIPDHLIFKEEGKAAHGPWECWSLLSALAAATSKMELGSLVLATSFRNPTLLAKMADTLDEISQGRLILGLGAGWHEPEYDAFGYPFDHRIGRFEEAIQIIRTLLREGRIDFEGTYYTARDCELRPRAGRAGGPPILVGALATKPRMMRLIAEHADLWNGWLVPHGSTPEAIPPLREAVDAACEKAGRDPSTLGRTAGILIDQREPNDRDTPAAGRGQAITGTPEEIAETLRGFNREGIDHLQLVPLIHGVAGVEALAPVIKALK